VGSVKKTQSVHPPPTREQTHTKDYAGQKTRPRKNLASTSQVEKRGPALKKVGKRVPGGGGKASGSTPLTARRETLGEKKNLTEDKKSL